MRTIAIIQARMSSKRLPGKVLLKLAGKPALLYVVERTALAKLVDEVVLATTTKKDDDKLVNFANKNKIKFFRGSENDVLDRYYRAAKLFKADLVVRITGDCPLIDYREIDKVIRHLKKHKYDFVSNCVPPLLPDGLDVEAVTFKTLEKIWREAKWASEREHAFSYIVRHEKLFKIGRITQKKDYSFYRLTLDYSEDRRFLNLVIGECRKKKKFCGQKELVEIIKRHPAWLRILDQRKRNESHSKMLKNDIIIK